uniref:Uncharacterized protein n=1 Tax=Onchocerca volvulus TaxID=6282 RepID=A0A8R1Y4S8_ONCVO
MGHLQIFGISFVRDPRVVFVQRFEISKVLPLGSSCLVLPCALRVEDLQKGRVVFQVRWCGFCMKQISKYDEMHKRQVKHLDLSFS